MTDATDFKDRIATASEYAPEPPRPLYRELPEPRPFPVDALGPILGNAAKAIATQIGCPVECAANSILAVASLASQGCANAILPIGEGKPVPLSLYLLTVLDSGERKSSADSLALRPVRAFERELAEANAGEQQAFESKLAAYTVQEKFLTNKNKGKQAELEGALRQLGPAPQPPLLPVLAPSGDQTMEGLFRVYQQGRPSLAMLCDDAATFLGGHSLKQEQKATTVANLCRAWDGSKLERIRGGDGVTILYDRRLAAHLMVQSGVAANFLSDPQFADQGLLARFLFSAPKGLAGTRIRDDAKYQAAMAQTLCDLQEYGDAIARLLRSPIRWKNEHDRTAGIELGALCFTSEARQIYVEFYNNIERKMGPDGNLCSIKAFASKLPENAARIAGTLELIANAKAQSIGAAMLGNAIKLAEYYLGEYVRLVAAGAIDPALREADKLRLWLQTRPENVIPLRDVYRLGPTSLRDAKSARAAMKVLEDHGWVLALPNGHLIDGQAHKEAWAIVKM
ncbi:MAG: YfjI family protein [Pseudomonadota bacterium]|nr:YfjI family protein [Pseudomonadota bacterium]